MSSIFPNPAIRAISGFSQNLPNIGRTSRRFHAAALEVLTQREETFFNDILLLDQQEVFEKYYTSKKVLFYMWIIYQSSFINWIYDTNRRVYIGLYESMLDADISLSTGLLFEGGGIRTDIFELPMAWLLNNGHSELVSKVVNKYQKVIKENDNKVFELLIGIINISRYQYIDEYSGNDEFYEYYYHNVEGDIKYRIHGAMYEYKKLTNEMIGRGVGIMVGYKNRRTDSPLTHDRAINLLIEISEKNFDDISDGISIVINWNQNICNLTHELLTVLMDAHAAKMRERASSKGKKRKNIPEGVITSIELFEAYISGATEVSLGEVKRAVELYKRFTNEYMNGEEPNEKPDINVKGIFPHTRETLVYLESELVLNHGKMVAYAVLFGFYDIIEQYLDPSERVTEFDVNNTLISGVVSEDDILKTLNVIIASDKDDPINPGYKHYLLNKIEFIMIKFYYKNLINPLVDYEYSPGEILSSNFNSWIDTNKYNSFITELYKDFDSRSTSLYFVRSSFEYMYLKSKGTEVYFDGEISEAWKYPAVMYVDYIHDRDKFIKNLPCENDQSNMDLFQSVVIDTIRK
jgi:hypothetical protein